MFVYSEEKSRGKENNTDKNNGAQKKSLVSLFYCFDLREEEEERSTPIAITTNNNTNIRWICFNCFY